MFLPEFLKQSEHAKILDLIRQFPFATLVLNTATGIEVDHLPLLIEKENNQSLVLLGHLAKMNSLCKQEIQGLVKVIFHGPDAYISPNWYPSKKAHGRAVPTWNYLVVHIEGDLKWQHDEEWKYNLLSKQTDFHEQGFVETWQLKDAPESYIKGMLKGIVGVKIEVKNLVAKWKVSQDKSDVDKQGVRDGLKKYVSDEWIHHLVAVDKD